MQKNVHYFHTLMILKYSVITPGKEYHIQGQIHSKTVGVVYLIYCNKCEKLVYVVHTGDTLYHGIVFNFSTIRTNTTYNIITLHVFIQLIEAGQYVLLR